MDVTPLGELLTKEGILSELQLKEALQIQKEEQQRIGDILVELGYVTRRQLKFIIKKYKRRIPLGEYLVESRLITNVQLEDALAQQKTSGRRLGEILIDGHIIQEEQLAETLSHQLDMPYIRPYPHLVDREVFKQLPLGFIRQNHILPLMQSEGITTILITGPLEDSLTFHLDKVFGHNVELAISSVTSIEETIHTLLDNRQTVPIPEIKAIEEDVLSAQDVLRVDMTSERLKKAGVETQVVDLVNYVVAEALKDRASDVHLESQVDRLRVRFRIDGMLVHKTDLPLSIRDALFRRIKVLSGLDLTETHKVQEGRLMGYLEGGKIDMRVSIFVSIYGEIISFRLLRQDVGLLDLEDLGMTPSVYTACRRTLDRASGVTLYSGPTGAGKTTSWYASLNYLNSPELNLMTLEDPVEYAIDGAVQIQLASHRGSSLQTLIRASLHQDPDVLAIGEIRDDEDAAEVMRAALTGHKVLTTFHADDAVGAIFRLLDAGLLTFFKSSTSLMVVCQRLVRKICSSCRDSAVPEPGKLQEFRLKNFDPDRYDFFHGKGCVKCGYTGFSGRTGIFEVLTINDALRELFLTGAKASQILKAARKSMPYLSLQEVGILAAIRGTTTVEEVLRVAPFTLHDLEDDEPLTIEEIERLSETSIVDYH